MVSIVVPVYNVEKYIRRCLDSILSQTYSDIELILVDDGSPDSCPKICDEYAQKDSRIKVIHKANGGVSAARNTGLDVVTGEYLTFCDSDDSYEPGWIEGLLTAMEKCDADVAVGTYRIVFEDGASGDVRRHTIGVYNTGTPDEKVNYAFSQIFGNEHGWEVCTRLFKTNIIQQNKIRFCETCGNFAEDMGFVLVYSLYANRVVSTSECGYHYFQRSGSMMHSSVGAIKFDCMNEVSMYFAKNCRQAFEKNFFERVLPIYHFLIMYDRYQVIIDTENYRYMRKYLKSIRRFSEWEAYTKELLPSRKVLEDYFGRYNAGRILMLSRYCLHGSWFRFKVACALYYRTHKPTA